MNDYEIVYAYTIEELKKKVDEFVKRGYKPAGGLTTFAKADGTPIHTMILCQAVYREEEGN